MAKTVRVTLFMNSDLLEQFDQTLVGRGSANRSEAVRRLIHYVITSETGNKEDREVVATLTLIYGHRCTELARRLTAMQHEDLDLIVSTTRVHIESDLCMEVLIMRGRAAGLADLAFRLSGIKGVLHGELVVATPDRAARVLLAASKYRR